MASNDNTGSNGRRAMQLMLTYLTLADGQTHTAAEVAAATGAAKRTVYRNFERLRAAGLDIQGTPKLGCRIAQAPQLTPLYLTRAERAALLAVAPAGLKAKLRAL